jgi:hypothetical protein
MFIFIINKKLVKSNLFFFPTKIVFYHYKMSKLSKVIAPWLTRRGRQICDGFLNKTNQGGYPDCAHITTVKGNARTFINL